jgi:hypothetical protein
VRLADSYLSTSLHSEPDCLPTVRKKKSAKVARMMSCGKKFQMDKKIIQIYTKDP